MLLVHAEDGEMNAAAEKILLDTGRTRTAAGIRWPIRTSPRKRPWPRSWTWPRQRAAR